MITSEKFEVTDLPFMMISEIDRLPELHCVYLVLNSRGEVLYVGSSVNLRRRWKTHHKLASLIGEPGIRIAYFELNENLLYRFEKALINEFKPPLNQGKAVKGFAALRQQAGFTQRQLADAVGVTESTIRNWENNRNGVEWLVRVAKLCTALDCTVQELVDYVSLVEMGNADS